MSQPSGTPARSPNRLATSTSPYLLQHAHNPVEWWPWGEAAFAEARRRDVSIFLSIGYSTCYWCHVMERECFENEAIAAQMNRDFVCIKLDREERPDVDDLYMAATQITTGHGGWPMSVFLEPTTLKPYWCATYLPPVPARGMPSFPQVLEGLAAAWRDKREEVVEQSKVIAGEVEGYLARQAQPVALGSAPVVGAIQSLLTIFDHIEGGFARAPKFPQPVYLEFLLESRGVAGDEATRTAIDRAITHTLDRMMVGGIFDHVGGGFHRYSVDAFWTVPHFEKMLYDNAMLASVYASASRAYGDREYDRVARRTLDYVLREMTPAGRGQGGGGFYSAQDAEVDGREGLNYLWQPVQVRNALAQDGRQAELAVKLFGLDASPNFQDPHHPEAPPAFVLRLSDRPDHLAASLSLSCDELHAAMDSIASKLLTVRNTRRQPRLDDKVLVEWNGMMIQAMARAGRLLNEPRYLTAAVQAAEFIRRELDVQIGEGGSRVLHRSWRAGRANIPALLSDHAWLILGLLELHESLPVPGASTSRKPENLSEHLLWAMELADRGQSLFADEATGRVFDTRDGQADLFLRTCSTYDGAIPSGVSCWLHALIRLGRHAGGERFTARAMRVLGSLSGAIADNPISVINATRAVLELLARGGDTARQLATLGPAMATSARATNSGTDAVEVFADTERLSVSARVPGKLKLRVRVAAGKHILAAEPVAPGEPDPGLWPLRVGLIPNSGSGVAVYADYPKGEPYGQRNELRVHHGEIEFDVIVERSGEWTGRPLLGVTYQVCTDTECLAPRTVELDVAIDRDE